MPKRTHRGHHEGSIYQVTTGPRAGTWYAQVTLPNGKRPKRAARTKREAQLRLADLQREAARGIAGDRAMTVGAWLESWLEHEVRGEREPRTYAGYYSAVHRHLIPALGRIPLAGLTPLHVRDLRVALADHGKVSTHRPARPMAPSSVNQTIGVLKTALAAALELRLVDYNAAGQVRRLRAPRKPKAALAMVGAQQILAAVADDRFEVAYVIGLFMGLRLAEVLGLRWEDINWDAGTVTVREQLARIPRVARATDGATRQRKPPKTEAGARNVPIPEPVAEALQRQRIRQLEARLAVGQRWTDTGLIVTNIYGGAPVEEKIRRNLKQRLAAAGLPGMKFHDLRHGYGDLLEEQGVSTRTVMTLMGHATMGETLQRYQRAGDDALRAAAERLSRGLSG